MSKRLSLSILGAALVTVVFWGSAFVGIRAGLQAYTPAHLAVLRFLTASLVLAVLAAARRMRLPARRDLPAVMLMGFFGFAFYNLALNTGEQHIEAGPASLLVQTLPIWTALLALLFLHERMRLWGWVGIAISFAGAAVIALGSGSTFELNGWALLILLAALSSSIYNIFQKRLLARYKPVEVTTYAIWAGTLLLLPFAGGLPQAVLSAAPGATLAVLYLGVFPAALAYATWAFVLSKMPAGQAVSFLYAVPVMAFLIGWVWLGEAPQPIDLLGGLLALAGVAVVNTFGKARA